MDSLSQIGEPISFREHLDVILKGYLKNTNQRSPSSVGNFGLINTEKVTALLLGHESRLARFKKLNLASVNLTTSVDTNKSNSNSSSDSSVNLAANTQHCNTNGSQYQENHSYEGRGGHGGSVQCQVCHIFGLDASICFHRFKYSRPHASSTFPTYITNLST